MEDFIQSAKSLSISISNCQQKSFTGQSFLFHEPSFVYRNPNINTFQICLNLNGDTVAGININLIGQKAQSQYRSPFGSVWSLKELTNEQLDFLIKQILSWCKKEKITDLVIRDYPFCYNPHRRRLRLSFLSCDELPICAFFANDLCLAVQLFQPAFQTRRPPRRFLHQALRPKRPADRTAFIDRQRKGANCIAKRDPGALRLT